MTTIVKGVDFVTLPTKDIAAAEEFYTSVLGLPLGKRYGKMPGVEFETGSLTLSVVQSEAFGMEFHVNRNPIALHVDDFDTAKAELESKGVQFLNTLDSGVCHMGFFTDPDGNVLMIHHRYAPPDARPPAVT